MTAWLWGLAGIAGGILLMLASPRWKWLREAGPLMGAAATALLMAAAAQPPRPEGYLLLLGLVTPLALRWPRRFSFAGVAVGATSTLALAVLSAAVLGVLVLASLGLAAIVQTRLRPSQPQ